MGSSLTKDGVDASTRTADASPEQSSAVAVAACSSMSTTATSARGLCPRAARLGRGQ